jgi:predicted dienelactone hydrolase
VAIENISVYCTSYGGYGVTVNTGACGALDQGSIPCSHPRQTKRSLAERFCMAMSNRESKVGVMPKADEVGDQNLLSIAIRDLKYPCGSRGHLGFYESSK